jgi:uncharacterized protein (TIGR00661 family)
MSLPFDVKYCYRGLGFVFGKKGGIDYLETFKKNNLKELFKEVRQLPVEDYDIVINDFEPVSAWACYLKKKSCIGLSHQIGVINKNAPHPVKSDFIGRSVLKYYAPASRKYGFHFLPYDRNVFTPVIREEVRNLSPVNNGHYTVYLPAYGDTEIIKVLSCFPEIEWQVFSKHSTDDYVIDHIQVCSIQNDRFLQSIASSAGVLCGAGFETPAEVLYLQKKLMVIPMKGQYEQQCNAMALKALGVAVLKSLKIKHIEKIRSWINDQSLVSIPLPDETDAVLEIVLKNRDKDHVPQLLKRKEINSASKFRDLVARKIFN